MQNPDKTCYRLSEVSEMLGLPKTTISYWGRAFPEHLTPKRTARGHRRYSPKDIEMLGRIRDLMHVRKMSIEGATRYLHATCRKCPARYSPLCRTPGEAVRLLKAVAETLDDGHALAKLGSVIKWIENGHHLGREMGRE